MIPSVRTMARIAGTFGLVCIGWVFFRADSISTAASILGRIATQIGDPSAWWEVSAHADHLGAFFPLAGVVVIVEWLTRAHAHPLAALPFPRPARWVLYTSLGWSTLYVMPEAPARFIYFQF